MNSFKLFLLAFVFTLFSSFTTNERTTTIVVLDGKALLVDIDHKGSILTTYMEVPEYFNSNKDHNTKVLEAKATYTRLTKEQMDQIRFITITAEGHELDPFMKSNLSDLSMHYHQTYANQIEITVAQNESNRDMLDYNVNRIKELLKLNGVSPEDINIDYKQDLGDEPTTFIKVVSNLKSLLSNN